MSLNELDQMFPLVIFLYGALLLGVLSIPRVWSLAQEHLPADYLLRLKAKRGLAYFCVVLGALWSLQNIWLN
jgi:hypothetical protein